MRPVFLSVDDVVDIHRDQIRRYGGAAGIREPSLLQSAVAQASATFDGKYLHRDLFEMASAYLFHIVMDHPFLDGNKRTGAAAALVFMLVNGIRVVVAENAFAEMVLDVAQGRIRKLQVAKFLRALNKSRA